jgi:sugar/nucleoside kinase (ribokinase family)
MSSADAQQRASPPRILCAGIIVLDEVFRVREFPKPDGKTQTNEFFVVNGGCAANAAVAIARLGGRATLVGPLGGPPGEDSNGDRVLAALTRENVDCRGCTRVPGTSTALSAIFIDARGDRMIVTYRDERVATALPDDPDGLVASADLVLADNRYPDFVRPVCEAARRRGLRVVLDGDRPTVEDDPLFAIASHVIFSSECLRETTGQNDLGDGLKRIARHTEAFLAASNGPGEIVYLDAGAVRGVPVFSVDAVDTLGAGDALHGGFALAMAEGKDEIDALRFGSAVAAIKCSRVGGSAGAPSRVELDAFLACNT